jgi:hypothetical protein
LRLAQRKAPADLRLGSRDRTPMNQPECPTRQGSRQSGPVEVVFSWVAPWLKPVIRFPLRPDQILGSTPGGIRTHGTYYRTRHFQCRTSAVNGSTLATSNHGVIVCGNAALDVIPAASTLGFSRPSEIAVTIIASQPRSGGASRCSAIESPPRARQQYYICSRHDGAISGKGWLSPRTYANRAEFQFE